MDIGRALTYYTEDPRWKEKLAIGTGVILVSSLLSVVLIGILGFAIVMGYSIRLVQNVRDGVDPVLPEWDQWGDDMVRGLKYMLVLLVWAVPIFFLSIPAVIGGALAESTAPASQTLGGLLALCGTCLVFLYSIMLAVMVPGITIWFARTEEFASGLQVGPIWAWTRQHIGEVIIVMILIWVASFVIPLVAMLAGILLCLVGLMVTLPLGALVTYLFQYHLFGQLAAAHAAPGTGSAALAPVTPTFQSDERDESEPPQTDDAAGEGEPPRPDA